MKRILLLAVACLICVPVAAAEPASGEAVFKSYAELAVGGVWTTTSAKGKIEDSYRWVAKDRFLQLTAKGGPIPFTAIIGVDPETKLCTWWIFNENGSIGKDVLTQESEGVWLLAGKGIGAQGSIRYKGRLVRVDANTLKEEVREFSIFGEEQPAGTLVWTRKR